MLGNISLSRRLRVVLPLDEQPPIPTTTAFRDSVMTTDQMYGSADVSVKWGHYRGGLSGEV